MVSIGFRLRFSQENQSIETHRTWPKADDIFGLTSSSGIVSSLGGGISQPPEKKNREFSGIPSGYVKHSYWKLPFIVDFPSYKMVIFHSYVSLPEGIFFFFMVNMVNNYGILWDTSCFYDPRGWWRWWRCPIKTSTMIRSYSPRSSHSLLG